MGAVGRLLTQDDLERSPIVANCAMNRERGLSGENSYAKELRFNLRAYLGERLRERGRVAWLDLCCGRGRALIEAVRYLHDLGGADRVRLVGVDLAGWFDGEAKQHPCLKLHMGWLPQWRIAEETFDLVTCVHGLHYVGDKLGAVQQAVAALHADGRFLAHLDFADVRTTNGDPLLRSILRTWRTQGVRYEPRKKLLSCEGRRTLDAPYRYLGADGQAGANWTGQPSVASFYAKM